MYILVCPYCIFYDIPFMSPLELFGPSIVMNTDSTYDICIYQEPSKDNPTDSGQQMDCNATNNNFTWLVGGRAGRRVGWLAADWQYD